MTLTDLRRNRLAYALLALLATMILAALPWSGWHSAWTVDSRTQIEMIKGISEHGLPYVENGPVSQYPELQARWNVAHGEKLWGLYPPLFAYVSAPFYLHGGVASVSRMNVLFVLFFALGTFAVARRFFRDALLGSIAACLAVLSTPVGAAAMDISSFTLAEALIVWTIFVAMLSFESPRFSGVLAIAAGLLGGCAISTHVITFAMVFGVVVALAQPDDQSWIPTRKSILRAGLMTVGVVIALVPMALLNHIRFGSYNPISYGPCVWASCTDTGIDQQSAGNMLRFALPSFAWLGATILAAYFFR
ncbi:MAG: hypothetical protein ABI183_05300, partial [Polyangiaceae bacterium]